MAKTHFEPIQKVLTFFKINLSNNFSNNLLQIIIQVSKQKFLLIWHDWLNSIFSDIPFFQQKNCETFWKVLKNGSYFIHSGITFFWNLELPNGGKFQILTYKVES